MSSPLVLLIKVHMWVLAVWRWLSRIFCVCPSCLPVQTYSVCPRETSHVHIVVIDFFSPITSCEWEFSACFALLYFCYCILSEGCVFMCLLMYSCVYPWSNTDSCTTNRHTQGQQLHRFTQKEDSLVLLSFTLPLPVLHTHLAHKTKFSQKNSMFQDQGHGLSTQRGRLTKRQK